MAERDTNHLLERIASALERLAPAEGAQCDLDAYTAYGWDGNRLNGYAQIVAPPLALLRGIDRQRETVAINIARHAAGAEAHDMLLWGSRGMGKSALVRAATVAACDHGPIALVQVAGDALPSLQALFSRLGAAERRFLLFIDDIGFGPERQDEARALRSVLEGGVAARPSNVRIAVTSNRRTIAARVQSDQDEPVSPRDEMDDTLALADRFGLSIGFHACNQDDYLAIVEGYAEHLGLDWNREEALNWSRRRGARSGRVARHFIAELAGRAGRTLD